MNPKANNSPEAHNSLLIVLYSRRIRRRRGSKYASAGSKDLESHLLTSRPRLDEPVPTASHVFFFQLFSLDGVAGRGQKAREAEKKP